MRCLLFIGFLLTLLPAGCGGADGSDGDLTADGDQEAAGPWDSWSCRGGPVGGMLGVASHMRQGVGEDENRDFEFARYDELGGAVVREHFRWDDLEPADDEWRFEVVERQVELAAAHRVRLIPQVGYDVDWAKTGEGDSSLIPEEYGQFAGTVAARWCDRIREYELWNEPDMTIFWEPEPDPDHYGRLVKQAYAAIRQACPDARVSLGGLASYSDVDLFDRWWFLRELQRAHPDIGSFFDAISLHPYTFMVSEPPENDHISGGYRAESQPRMVEMARELLAAIGRPEAPIWFTEVGWPSLGLDEGVVAVWLSRSALLAARDGIEFYLWYTFFDSEPEPDEPFDNWSNYFGLFGWPGDPIEPRREKPAWRALKGLSQVVGDACFARDLSPDLGLPGDVYALGFLRPDGSRLVAAWDGREVPDLIEGVASAGGADTTCGLSLPLPERTTTVTTLDREGTERAVEAAAGNHQTTLTPDPVFLLIGEE